MVFCAKRRFLETFKGQKQKFLNQPFYFRNLRIVDYLWLKIQGIWIFPWVSRGAGKSYFGFFSYYFSFQSNKRGLLDAKPAFHAISSFVP